MRECRHKILLAPKRCRHAVVPAAQCTWHSGSHTAWTVTCSTPHWAQHRCSSHRGWHQARMCCLSNGSAAGGAAWPTLSVPCPGTGVKLRSLQGTGVWSPRKHGHRCVQAAASMLSNVPQRNVVGSGSQTVTTTGLHFWSTDYRALRLPAWYVAH